ncbi:ABC-2 type transport system permease protein [Bacillus thermophilus]|uniref:ABC-2 type transport system permease protein n=1 Tax=Siminovitchia thermophila TaxID=1245522 RepID=A0ABS2R618_9BACI|nr:ABC transporter permease [Siminovitchia thermophila]MBM7715067.1 ABC-2 type transport system permease protein [Siminovitchia thermophila]ONK22848.1 ABC transporter permease [Bacillus sp. VT-16-64]
MKQIESLWPERLHSFMKEIRRYFKYMLNDHVRFVLIFGGGAAIYYYSQWIRTIGPDFPGAAIAAVMLAGFLAASPIITLLKQPDAVFLSPLEKRLSGYFQKGGRLSFILQSYLLLLVLAALMPLLNRTVGADFRSFFIILACLLLLKIWNIRMHWNALKSGKTASLITDFSVRSLLNGFFLFFLITQSSVMIMLAVALFIVAYTLYSESKSKEQPLKWERLIEKESGRMQLFYRTANMFTDVPHLKSRVGRRKWLDPIFRFIPYGQQQVYVHLFSRTLLRTKEFSGLILRLSVIPAILLWFVANPYIAVAISVAFLYLTGFQLLPVYRRNDVKVWVHLYPISPHHKKKAFLKLLLFVLAGQAILFVIIQLLNGNFLNAVYIGGASAAFTAWFVKVYAAKKVGAQRFE